MKGEGTDLACMLQSVGVFSGVGVTLGVFSGNIKKVNLFNEFDFSLSNQRVTKYVL